MNSKGLYKAIFPGTFDPLTNGHVDIARRVLSNFDTLVVGVLENPLKNTLFSVDERKALIAHEFKDFGERVIVSSFSGLLVNFVKSHGPAVVVRGLRATSDYDYEAQMALANKKLDPNVETFFLMTSETSSYISSSLVRQIALFGGDVASMVPEHVRIALLSKC